MPRSPSSASYTAEAYMIKVADSQKTSCGVEEVPRLPRMTELSALRGVFRLSSKRRLSKTNSRKNVHTTNRDKRRVRFNDRNDDSLSIKVDRYERFPRSYHPFLFLSSKEKAEIQFLARSEAETFLFDEEETVLGLETAFLRCAHEQLFFETENAESLKVWATGPVRGLEDTVSEVFEQERLTAVAMILKYEKYLKQTVGPNCDELLRRFSERISLRSRQFCVRMGVSDAYAAFQP